MPVVELIVESQDVELAYDALWQGSPSAVTEEAQDDGRVRLVADVQDLDAIPFGWRWSVVDVDPDVEDAWRRYAAPVRAGRFVLQPVWLPEEPVAEGEVAVPLDPGRVFGSGSHASTRQVLELLDGVDLAGAAVLDVGSGSGVLSIAALRCGAATAVATDIDPAATAIGQANAVRNGVDAQLDASDRPLAEIGGRYDVVFGNIGAGVLIELAPLLLDRVVPHGVLLLAGLLDEQVDDVLAAYAPATEEARVSDGGWTAVRLRA